MSSLIRASIMTPLAVALFAISTSAFAAEKTTFATVDHGLSNALAKTAFSAPFDLTTSEPDAGLTLPPSNPFQPPFDFAGELAACSVCKRVDPPFVL